MFSSLYRAWVKWSLRFWLIAESSGTECGLLQLEHTCFCLLVPSNLCCKNLNLFPQTSSFPSCPFSSGPWHQQNIFFQRTDSHGTFSPLKLSSVNQRDVCGELQHQDNVFTHLIAGWITFQMSEDVNVLCFKCTL